LHGVHTLHKETFKRGPSHPYPLTTPAAVIGVFDSFRRRDDVKIPWQFMRSGHGAPRPRRPATPCSGTGEEFKLFKSLRQRAF
jgi:hypothetical protein